MLPKVHRYLRICGLLAFVLVSLSINFCHTEKSAAGQATCPACHFLVFSQSVGPVLSFIVPLLVVLGAVIVETTVRFRQTGFRLFPSRSPPTA